MNTGLRKFVRFLAIYGLGLSLFVFKGQYRAVLINYPTQQQKDELC